MEGEGRPSAPKETPEVLRGRALENVARGDGFSPSLFLDDVTALDRTGALQEVDERGGAKPTETLELIRDSVVSDPDIFFPLADTLVERLMGNDEAGNREAVLSGLRVAHLLELLPGEGDVLPEDAYTDEVRDYLSLLVEDYREELGLEGRIAESPELLAEIPSSLRTGAAPDVAPDVSIPEPPPEQDDPIQLLTELKSLYQRQVNGEYVSSWNMDEILVRVTQSLGLPPEQNFQDILHRGESSRRDIDHPFSNNNNLRRFLENDPQLFERVFNGAPAEIREAAQQLPIVKDDLMGFSQQANPLFKMIDSQLKPDLLLLAQQGTLFERDDRLRKNFQETLLASDPATQQEVIQQALVSYLQAINETIAATQVVTEDKYRRRNELMEKWAGVRILAIRYGDEITYIERPSPQSESLLPLGERAKLESLIPQMRKIPVDNSDKSVDAMIQVTEETEALLNSTLSKRKELGFVPEKDKTLPLKFNFYAQYHNNPTQKDLIRRVMQYASPRLQTTFATYEEAVKAYQENREDRAIGDTYYERSRALDKALDEEAGLISLNEEVARNAKETNIPDRVFNLLIRKPGVDQTTVGELVEAYIKKRKADDSYQLSEKRRIEKYNEFFAGLASKSGLKLEVKTKKGYVVSRTGKPSKELVLARKGIFGR